MSHDDFGAVPPPPGGARRDPRVSIPTSNGDRSARIQTARARGERIGRHFGTLAALLVAAAILLAALVLVGALARGVVRAVLIGWQLG